jgi:hypothetical protein
MHNLVRQYSDDKLAHAPGRQEGIVRQKHSDYFLRQVDEWSISFKGPYQAATLVEADKLIDDVMAA